MALAEARIAERRIATPTEWTPEKRAEHAAKIRAGKEAKARLSSSDAAASATDLLEPPDEPTTEDHVTEEVQDEPTSENVLGQLAGLFQQAAGKSAGREKAINEAIDVLGKLNPLKYPEIASNHTVQAFVEQVQTARLQSADVPPGTIMGTGLAAVKKPWTKGDLMKGKDMPIEEARKKGFIEWVMYRPIRNFDVTWNGIRILWPARREGYFPKSHVDAFEQSLDADEWNEQHAAWLFNNPEAVIHGDYFSTNGPRVKAMDQSRGEYYQPGAGMISMAASPELIDNSEGES